MVAEGGVPGECAWSARPKKARTKRDVGTAFDNWGQQTRELSWSIAVIAVQENYDVRIADVSKACKAGPTVSAAWLADNSRSHARRNFRGAVGRVVVDD